MSKKDYYEVLGVDHNAEKQVIKKAYKRMAMKHHPDRNPNDKEAAENKFKEIQEAYSILSNPEKRQSYDQFGHGNVNGGFEQSPFGDNPFSGFGDIFGDIFSGAGSAKQNFRGNDLQYDMEISLPDAISGAVIKIRIPRMDTCETCKGSGAKPSTPVNTCGTCKGSGTIHIQQGFFAVQKNCAVCDGSGQVIEQKCTTCHGAGAVENQKTLSIKIPAGVDTGNRIKLTGEGEAGTRGAPHGDLYVKIYIKDHSIFSRTGKDLYCEVPIDIGTATLGGKLQVPTINSQLEITIPPGTQTGKTFRLRERGAPDLNNGQSGDILCKVKVETPVNLNKEQEELLRSFSVSCGHNHHPESKTFFDKMKSFFD